MSSGIITNTEHIHRVFQIMSLGDNREAIQSLSSLRDCPRESTRNN
jgi:hypothetical protein